MKWSTIRGRPTSIQAHEFEGGVHESVLRSFQILEKVKDYLKRGVPADVILELIDEAQEREITQVENR